MIESAKHLLAHAVGQCGRDRTYSVRFGGSSPIIMVYEDSEPIAEFWMVNEVIHEKKFY